MLGFCTFEMKFKDLYVIQKNKVRHQDHSVPV